MKNYAIIEVIRDQATTPVRYDQRCTPRQSLPAIPIVLYDVPVSFYNTIFRRQQCNALSFHIHQIVDWAACSIWSTLLPIWPASLNARAKRFSRPSRGDALTGAPRLGACASSVMNLETGIRPSAAAVSSRWGPTRPSASPAAAPSISPPKINSRLAPLGRGLLLYNPRSRPMSLHINQTPSGGTYDDDANQSPS